MLIVHLLQHEHAGDADRENLTLELDRHLQWAPAVTARVVRAAEERGLVRPRGALLEPTATGRRLGEEAVVGAPVPSVFRASGN
jgi:hypothetical protein